jgi:hypothetical protein
MILEAVVPVGMTIVMLAAMYIGTVALLESYNAAQLFSVEQS